MQKDHVSASAARLFSSDRSSTGRDGSIAPLLEIPPSDGQGPKKCPSYVLCYRLV